MPGSDAVIGLPDAATAMEYDMDDYSTPVESAEQVSVCVCVCVCFPCVSVLAKNENISSVVLLMPGGEWRVHRRVKRRNASEGEETKRSGLRSRADLS